MKKRRKLPTHIPGQSHSQVASEQVQVVTVVNQEVQCIGSEELTTATEAEALLKLDTAKNTFSLVLVGDSDCDSGLESEKEY